MVFLPFLKCKEDCSKNTEEGDDVIPFQLFAQIQNRKCAEDNKRDNFLHDFQLRGGKCSVPNAICRNLKAVFKERDPPTDEDDFPECDFLKFEMTVPRKGHKQIGDREECDRFQRVLLVDVGLLKNKTGENTSRPSRRGATATLLALHST